MIAAGLLWYDDDVRRPLALKLAEAADRYRERVGFEPTTCFLNPAQIPAPPPATGRGSRKKVVGPPITLRLVSDEHLRPNYFFVGIGEDERPKRVRGWRDDLGLDQKGAPPARRTRGSAGNAAKPAKRAAPIKQGRTATPTIAAEVTAAPATPSKQAKVAQPAKPEKLEQLEQPIVAEAAAAPAKQTRARKSSVASAASAASTPALPAAPPVATPAPEARPAAEARPQERPAASRRRSASTAKEVAAETGRVAASVPATTSGDSAKIGRAPTKRAARTTTPARATSAETPSVKAPTPGRAAAKHPPVVSDAPATSSTPPEGTERPGRTRHTKASGPARAPVVRSLPKGQRASGPAPVSSVPAVSVPVPSAPVAARRRKSA